MLFTHLTSPAWSIRILEAGLDWTGGGRISVLDLSEHMDSLDRDMVAVVMVGTEVGWCVLWWARSGPSHGSQLLFPEGK